MTSDTAADEPELGVGDSQPLIDGGALNGLIGGRLDGLISRPRLIDTLLVTAGLVAGWLFRFSQDDAFISFRYASNFAAGHGLVFNIGERVEGYTNFLWTVLMAIPFRQGWDPLVFAHLVGLVCFAATLLAVRRLATMVFGDTPASLLAAVVFVTSHTVVVYGTGSGLETQLQAALLAWALLVALRLRQSISGDRERSTSRMVGLSVVWSVLAGLALLTRLDSSVYLLALGLALLAWLWAARSRLGGVAGLLLAGLIVPAMCIVGPWLVWKTGYYGSILPNTLAAKSTPIGWAVIRAGMYLVIYFVVTFQLLLVPIVIRHRRATGTTAELRVMRVVLGLWLLYLVVVGADFMEFRFLVCVLPLAAVLVTAVLLSLESRKVLVFALLVLLLGSGLKWKLMPPAVFGVESATGLDQHGLGDSGWRAIGEELASAFPGGQHSPVTIAVTPAGFVPFYSGLPTIDMLGLTEPAVLDHSCELTKLKAGHEQIATPAFLVERGADLVLGSLQVVEPDATRTSYPMEDVRNIFLGCSLHRSDLPEDARIIEIPLPDGKVVLALQLRPDDVVDEAVRTNGWRTFAITGN
jgi:arabinofuranosyltransferase